MQQDDQVPGALIEDSIAGPCEPDPQLPQLPFYLRRGRELWRWIAWITTIQMLLDGIVDLRGSERLGLQQHSGHEQCNGLDHGLHEAPVSSRQMLTLDVAINLLSDVIWELGLKPLYQASAAKFSRSREQPPELEAAIARGAAQLATPGESDDVMAEAWCSFLASREVRTLMLDLFMFKMAGRKTSTTPILEALTLAWIRHVGSDSATDLNTMFDRLEESIQGLIKVAVEADILALGQSRATARKQIVSSRVKVIAALDSTTPDAQQAHRYEQFTAELRTETAMRYGKIEPPNLVAREPVEIERLFVPPRIDSQLDSTELAGFVRSIDRRVVLGNPGAGKSTLAAKICHDLALSYTNLELNPRRVTPWCIELRRLATSKKRVARPLAEFFAEWAEGSYQLSVPEGAFEWLLSRGQLLVVFDGLDELLDISIRQDVRNAVESFCRRYANTPVLITSRIVGYGQTPLDEDVFDTVKLMDFDQRRVGQYATKWFDIRSEDEPAPVRRQQAAQFMRDTAHTRELRSNPLMLGLLASLHRGPGSIPRNLPDVYDSCATLLFSTWDKLKGLDIVLPFSEHIRPALRELAWWMFTNPKLAEGVTRPQAVERTADYLEHRRFGSRERARSAAEDFIDFCRGRAWVFTDQGSTATNEDLFGFTHRTFLEFFTAEYLAYRKQSTEELVGELVPLITREEWDVVTRIALQIKARMYPDGADDIITALLNSLQGYSGHELAAGVGFLLRLLQGVIPSPTIMRRLGSQMMVYAVKAGGSSERLYGAIAAVGEENRVEIARGLSVGQRELLSRGSSRHASIAADIIFRPGRLVAEPAQPFWEAVGRQTRKAYGEDIRAAAKAYLAVGLAAWPSVIGMQELISSHGVRAAFCPVLDSDAAPVRQLLEHAPRARGNAWSKVWSEVGTFGVSLATTDAPWFGVDRAGVISLYVTELVALAKTRGRPLPDEAGRIALSLIFICVAEALMRLGTQSNRDRQLLDRLIAVTRRSGDQLFGSLSSVLEAGNSKQAVAPHDLLGLDVPKPVRRFVADWAQGKVRTLSS